MAKTRTKWYERHGISKERLGELKNIALQYDNMVKEEKRLRRGEVDRPQSGNRTWKQSDPTGNAAIYIASRSKADKIRAVEDSARTVTAGAPGVYRALMRSVTRGEFEREINPPCGHAQFCAMRRRFYLELDRRLA